MMAWISTFDYDDLDIEYDDLDMGICIVAYAPGATGFLLIKNGDGISQCTRGEAADDFGTPDDFDPLMNFFSIFLKSISAF
jgi:hypothetical protein